MEESAPAIRALGHLFKLTQVNLWDDEALDVGVGFSTKLYKSLSKDKGEPIEESSIEAFSLSAEDLETSRQMDVLGLPLSFQTSKEKRVKHKTTRVKTRIPKKKSIELQNGTNDEMLDVIRIPDEKITAAACINYVEVTPVSSLGEKITAVACINYVEVTPVSSSGEAGLPCPDITLKTDETSQVSNGGDGVGDASTPCNAVVSNPGSDFNLISECRRLLERDTELSLSRKLEIECSTGSFMVENGNGHGGMTELYQDPKDYEVTNDDAQCETLVCEYETGACSESTEMVDSNTAGSTSEDVFADWRSCWDEHNMQTYYYNVSTLISTWDPPPGVTDSHFPRAFDASSDIVVGIEQSKVNVPDSGEESVESVEPSLVMSKESIYGSGSLCETYSESLEIDRLAEGCDSADKKKKTKTRVLKLEVFEEISPSINKYWLQRYLLFSRFDEGIQMDEEGWFSVTPERIAIHHAKRCEGGVIIDCFTGVGGNAIQFAKRSQHVVAIDIDPTKIDYARHNAAIYGVEDAIDFVVGDSFRLASLMKADTVFLSPPWGGPDYSKVKTFDMNTMLQPHDGLFLFNTCKRISPKVVMYLPRNVDINQLAEIAMSSNPPWSLEVEKNYLNGKLKAITAYFNEPAALERDTKLPFPALF